MAFYFTCPYCDTEYSCDDSLVGQIVSCPTCKAEVLAMPNENGMIMKVYKPKCRIYFILLGVFFGFFGIHNFYAGYKKEAQCQCFVTIILLLATAIVVIPLITAYFSTKYAGNLWIPFIPLTIWNTILTVWLVRDLVMKECDVYGITMD